jgi:5'-nucleotidase
VVLAVAVLLLGAAPAFAGKPCRPTQIKVQLLAVNDFHGALDGARISKVSGRPVGGASNLAGYIDAARAEAAKAGESTLLLGGGDLIGAAQPVSALLKEEPTIRVLNAMDMDVSVVGNHEFDKGYAELQRIIHGDLRAGGTFEGARFPYLGANVVRTKTGRHALRPYVVRKVGGVRVAFIGVILHDAPTIISPAGIEGLTFADESDTVNHYVRKLHRRGIRAFVVLLHQGGSGTTAGSPITGDVVSEVQDMDPDVDVVVSAHSHAGYQGMIGTKLVTQAYSNGTAYADIDLTLDRKTDDVVAKSAAIVTTWADAGVALNPAVAEIVDDALVQVAPIINQVVGAAGQDILKAQNAAGESPLGDLIADAQRARMQTQICFMNPGGVRADVLAGPVTWGALFTTQPFNNYVMSMKMTGQQIHDVLEQQWAGQPYARVLQVSGIGYTWHTSEPVGDRVDPAEVSIGGSPLELSKTYTVAANNYIAGGGDNFSMFKSATDKVTGPVDIDALVDYVKALPQPFGAPDGGRILSAP